MYKKWLYAAGSAAGNRDPVAPGPSVKMKL
eukprot:SAG31_NODE_29603_length_392_cov_1.389078_2_plen_29_part_01